MLHMFMIISNREIINSKTFSKIDFLLFDLSDQR